MTQSATKDISRNLECLWEQIDRQTADIVALKAALQCFGNAFHWEMLPNGQRGWVCESYLHDEEMKEFCRLSGVKLPKLLRTEPKDAT